MRDDALWMLSGIPIAHVHVFWKRVNDEVFHHQLYPFDILDPATLDTKFHINNIEAFEIFFSYVCTFL